MNSNLATVAIYVDDLNIVGTLEEISITVDYLKKRYEMKDLGKTKFCLGFQVKHLRSRLLIHQSTYIEKLLKQFNTDKSCPLSSPVVVHVKMMKKFSILKHHILVVMPQNLNVWLLILP